MQVIIRCKGRCFCPEDVPGDGNCYFRSLCKDPFFSSQNYDHRSLRRELYNRIDSNTELKNKLSRFFVHYTTVDNLSDFDEYLNAMENDKFWAGGLESMMIFFVFNVNVICLQAARQHPSEDAIIPHKFDFIDYSTNIEYLGLVTNEELLVLKSKEVKEIWPKGSKMPVRFSSYRATINRPKTDFGWGLPLVIIILGISAFLLFINLTAPRTKQRRRRCKYSIGGLL